MLKRIFGKMKGGGRYEVDDTVIRSVIFLKKDLFLEQGVGARLPVSKEDKERNLLFHIQGIRNRVQRMGGGIHMMSKDQLYNCSLYCKMGLIDIALSVKDSESMDLRVEFVEFCTRVMQEVSKTNTAIAKRIQWMVEHESKKERKV